MEREMDRKKTGEESMHKEMDRKKAGEESMPKKPELFKRMDFRFQERIKV